MLKKILVLLFLLTALIFLNSVHSSTAQAAPNATLTVNTLADNETDGCATNNCTLREAITDAIADDTINFNVSGIINTSSNGELTIDKNLTIDGGANAITIHGGDSIRIFNITAGNVTFSNLTITHGSGINGGGIYNAGRLMVSNCTISNNAATFGGGINNNRGTVTISNSTFSSNDASNDGGGINNNRGTVTISNSTFINNTAADNGGGIESYQSSSAEPATLTISNSTFSGNTAGNDGGGIHGDYGTTGISNSTFSGNTATGYGDGIRQDHGSLALTNTIVSQCSSNFTTDTGNNNLIESNFYCADTNIITNSPQLSPLADNGGSTHTHALQVGSPAIDAGDDANCESNDQRGATRTMDGDGNGTSTCDIGAFELGGLQCGIGSATLPVTYTFGDISLEVTATGTNLDCLRVTDIPSNHPDATSGGSGQGIATGKYWTINGLQSDQSTTASTGYALNLTLPHNLGALHANAKVCKYPGTQGGYGWDCFRTNSNISNVWLDGIQSLSDWAVGDQVGPTAVSLHSTTAVSENVPVLLLVLLGILLLVGTTAVLRQKI